MDLHDLRIDYAWEMVHKADTVTLLTASEVKTIMDRAQAGEFDVDILQPTLSEYKARLAIVP